jgi:thiamine-monophosphate kinase
VSDICAMNAKATQITVSVAVSNRFPRSTWRIIWRCNAAAEYKVDVIGGDTTISKGLIISITAIGEADEEEIVYRNGPRKPIY